mmetsp:Transcript_28677/g.33697  ORF Transcript_28677/g.33697 Transcript_28677/m.33697 type:complete len:101 (+) Transcript_28677:43-345(+)
MLTAGKKAKNAGKKIGGKTVDDITAEPQMQGMMAPAAAGGKGKSKKVLLIPNEKYFIFRFINQGYMLFRIVKNFTCKFLWNSSCLAFMFLLPMMFEVLCE